MIGLKNKIKFKNRVIIVNKTQIVSNRIFRQKKWISISQRHIAMLTDNDKCPSIVSQDFKKCLERDFCSHGC